MLLIFDLSELAAPITAAAKYLSKRLPLFPTSKSLQPQYWFKRPSHYRHRQKNRHFANVTHFCT